MDPKRERFEQLYSVEATTAGGPKSSPPDFSLLKDGVTYSDLEVRRAWYWFTRDSRPDSWYNRSTNEAITITATLRDGSRKTEEKIDHFRLTSPDPIEAIELTDPNNRVGEGVQTPLSDIQIESVLLAAEVSYRSYKLGIRGQAITPQDNFNWHVVRATEDAHGIIGYPR